MPYVSVEACEKCITTARNEASSEGYSSRDDEVFDLKRDIEQLEKLCRQLQDDINERES
jgi:hypothetical protein